MDGNLTNSKLLQHILESAETIKKEKGKKILTVNHVFAAVLSYASHCCDTLCFAHLRATKVLISS